MNNSKSIKNNNSLFVLTNTNNLTNHLASGVILPKSASAKCLAIDNLPNTNFVYLFESFSASDASFSEQYRKTDNVSPVVIEIKKSAINFFSNTNIEKQKQHGNNFFLLPFIPIYFIDSIHFKTSEDMENFMDIKFSNIDKQKLCEDKIKISENYFSSYTDNIYEDDSEPFIPLSQINVIDSIIGGIQVLIYLAKKEKSVENTKTYTNFVKAIVNKTDNKLVDKIFGFDLIDLINKGISAISVDDSLDLKIFKATILNLSAEPFQGVNFDSILRDLKSISLSFKPFLIICAIATALLPSPCTQIVSISVFR